MNRKNLTVCQMPLDFDEIKQKAVFVVGVFVLFALIYKYGTNETDWNHYWRPGLIDNAFFSLGTTVTADTANISPISTKAKLLVMLQMLMVVVIILWDL